MREVSFNVTVTRLAPDPSGRFLYVALDELSPAGKNATPAADVSGRIPRATLLGGYTKPPITTVIDELDAATGRILASAGEAVTIGPAGLTAVDGGVVVSFRTGMNGNVVLLRQDGLREATLPRSPARELVPVPRMNDGAVGGIESILLGSRLWL